MPAKQNAPLRVRKQFMQIKKHTRRMCNSSARKDSLAGALQANDMTSDCFLIITKFSCHVFASFQFFIYRIHDAISIASLSIFVKDSLLYYKVSPLHQPLSWWRGTVSFLILRRTRKAPSLRLPQARGECAIRWRTEDSCSRGNPVPILPRTSEAFWGRSRS